MTVSFSETDLAQIPSQSKVQVLMSVTPSDNLCSSFKDIGLQIMSTCESPSASSYVRQYVAKQDENGQAVIDYSQYSEPLSDVAKFSVSWVKSSSSRRLSNIDETEENQNNIEQLQKLLLTLEGSLQETLDQKMDQRMDEILHYLTYFFLAFVGISFFGWLFFYLYFHQIRLREVKAGDGGPTF